MQAGSGLGIEVQIRGCKNLAKGFERFRIFGPKLPLLKGTELNGTFAADLLQCKCAMTACHDELFHEAGSLGSLCEDWLRTQWPLGQQNSCKPGC